MCSTDLKIQFFKCVYESVYMNVNGGAGWKDICPNVQVEMRSRGEEGDLSHFVPFVN